MNEQTLMRIAILCIIIGIPAVLYFGTRVQPLPPPQDSLQGTVIDMRDNGFTLGTDVLANAPVEVGMQVTIKGHYLNGKFIASSVKR
jgi:hypothetical protein